MKRNTPLDALSVAALTLLFTCLILHAAVIIDMNKTEAATVIEPDVEVCSEEVEVEIVPSYTEEELFYMAAAIYNEAGGDECSDETRRLVGYVILNRVNDSRYPNSIKGVLEQRSQYGRFHWTGIKFADRAALPQEQEAVTRAYIIAKECLEAETIPIPATVLYQAEFEQGVGLYSCQDGMYFCYAQEVK